MAKKQDFLIALALAVVCAVVYGQTLGHGFINYDDDRFITRNPHVQAGLSPATLRWAFTLDVEDYFMPLAWLSHALDWQLFGQWPGGHHLTNLILHAVNSVLVFWLLLRLTGARWPATLVAALFAVHPLHVESVAWASERKDVLAMLFWTLTALAYVRYTGKPSVKRYLLVAAAFALALMSKPTVVTLPCVLLLFDYWPLERIRTCDWRSFAHDALTRLIEKMPLFLLAILDALTTFFWQGSNTGPMQGTPFPLSDRLANVPYSIVFYMVKALLPFNLAPAYPYPADGFVAWQTAASFLALTGVTLFAIFLWRKKPFLIVGWLWFLLVLAPTLQILQKRPFLYARADRYMYCGLIGLSIVAVWGARELVRNKRAGAIAATVVLVIFTAAALVQTGYWRNSETLFTHAIAVTKDNALAHYNLGTALLHDGRLAEAERQFRLTIGIAPRHADAHSNLGSALYGEKRYDEAAAESLTAITIDPTIPKGHYNYATALSALGRNAEALPEFEAALKVDPDNADIHFNYANALIEEKKLAEAEKEYREALRLKPGYAGDYMNLGAILMRTGKTDEAIAAFTEATRRDPERADAFANLGYALAEKGRYPEAADALAAAVKLKPSNSRWTKSLESLRAFSAANAPYGTQLPRQN